MGPVEAVSVILVSHRSAESQFPNWERITTLPEDMLWLPKETRLVEEKAGDGGMTEFTLLITFFGPAKHSK